MADAKDELHFAVFMEAEFELPHRRLAPARGL